MDKIMLLQVEKIEAQFAEHIVGQSDICRKMLIALLTGGNILLTGVPGVGKTQMVKVLASILGLTFRRIQFTPDLMPSDITGTEILENGQLRFVEGPIFAHIVLADEINRTPPKTQSALLEAMEEKTVTVLGKTRRLGNPFLVLATQNPMEFEGTYPLPEAQLDRFLFNIDLSYLSEAQELQMVKLTTGIRKPVQQFGEVLTWLAQSQDLVRLMPMSDELITCIVKLVRDTRPEATSLSNIKSGLRWGAGPRAIQCLVLAAKADALLSGQTHVTKTNISKFVVPILKHRVIAEPNGEKTLTDLISECQHKSGL